MATKTISIGEDAYTALSSHKLEFESFTDVIKRLTKQRSLLDISGVLTKKEADSVRQHIKNRRKLMRERIDKIKGVFSE